MPETYEEIINEIKSCEWGNDYLERHNCGNNENAVAVNVALHVAARVREAVGGDPAEWWVKDADGNRVHIGDDVKNCYSNTFEVISFGYRDGRRIVEYDNGYDYVDTVRKVIPDTRENIIARTKKRITGWTINDIENNEMLTRIVSDAVDSAMKLAEVDA